MANHTRFETRLRAANVAANREYYLDLVDQLRAGSQIVGADSVCITSDQTVTTAAYGMDKTVGGALIAGTYADVAAWADVDMLAHARAYTLAGATPVALTEGYSYVIMVLSIIVNGAIVDALVFGNAALSGAEVTPTLTQCATALRLSGLTNYLPSPMGIVQGTVTMRRIGVKKLTYSGTPDVGAPADNVTITYNGIEVVNFNIVSAVLNTTVASLEGLLDTALAAEPVTVTVAGAVITVTADPGEILAALTSIVTLGGAGDLAVVPSDADTIAGTHSAATTDSIKSWRLAGALMTP